jgi:hypothetical protein
LTLVWFVVRRKDFVLTTAIQLDEYVVCYVGNVILFWDTRGTAPRDYETWHSTWRTVVEWKTTARQYLKTRREVDTLPTDEFHAFYDKWLPAVTKKLGGEDEEAAKALGFRDALVDSQRARTTRIPIPCPECPHPVACRGEGWCWEKEGPKADGCTGEFADLKRLLDYLYVEGE